MLKSHIQLTIAKPLPLREVAILLENASKINVILDLDINKDVSSTFIKMPIYTGKSVDGIPAPPSLNFLKPLTKPKRRIGIPTWQSIGPWLQYSGNKADLFQTIADRYGVWQKFDDDKGEVRFYNTESKTFIIPAFSEKTHQSTVISAITGVLNNNFSSTGKSKLGSGTIGGNDIFISREPC